MGLLQNLDTPREWEMYTISIGYGMFIIQALIIFMMGFGDPPQTVSVYQLPWSMIAAFSIYWPLCTRRERWIERKVNGIEEITGNPS